MAKRGKSGGDAGEGGFYGAKRGNKEKEKEKRKKKAKGGNRKIVKQ